MSRAVVLIDATTLAADIARGEPVIVLSVGPATEGIPNAVPVDPAVFAGEGGGLRGARPLPDIADLQAAVRAWGVNDDTRIVLYDGSGNLTTARGWWTLKWAGLKDVRLLDGGIAAWEEADLPFAALSAAPQAGAATLSAGHLPQIDTDDAAAYARHDILIDARAGKAFGGGHIPGARNLPAGGNLDENDRFLSDDRLRARYAFRDGARIGVSCGSGVSAAHDIVALAIIGVEAALYVGSWSAWTADASRPVEYEAA